MTFSSRLPIILVDYARRHLEDGEVVAAKRFLEAGKMYRIVCAGGPHPDGGAISICAVDESSGTTAAAIQINEAV